MVRSLHLAVGFPVVTHVLTPPPAHLAPCGPKRPAAPRHMSHCSAPHPCPMQHARAACNSSVSSKPCASRPTTLSARPCPRASRPTHCPRISVPLAIRPLCPSHALLNPRASLRRMLRAWLFECPSPNPHAPPPRTSRPAHCLRISAPHASRMAMHALSAPPARPCTIRFASRASFECASHVVSAQKMVKVCALTPKETASSKLARLNMPATRHYSNRQILYSASEKLKRVLLGLLDKPDAAEQPNHTRRTVSRAKNDSGRAPDAFRDAAAVLVAVAIDAAGLRCPRPEREQGNASNWKSPSMLLNCLSSPAGRGGRCSSSAGRPSYAA